MPRDLSTTVKHVGAIDAIILCLLQDNASSVAMRKTAGMWGPLKPAPLKMVFGTGDVEEPGRQTKRPKR